MIFIFKITVKNLSEELNKAFMYIYRNSLSLLANTICKIEFSYS